MNAFDPLPPRGGTGYDDAYFAPAMGGGGGGAGGGGGRRREDNEMGQDQEGLMQAFFRAIQGVQGLEGWQGAMNQMDDETRVSRRYRLGHELCFALMEC